MQTKVMPDRDVQTLQDLIWYQYAKIIARRALSSDAKPEDYCFTDEELDFIINYDVKYRMVRKTARSTTGKSEATND